MGSAYLDLGELLAVARSHGSQQQFSLKVGCSNSEWAPILHGRVEFLDSDGLPLMDEPKDPEPLAPVGSDTKSKGRRARQSWSDGSKASRGTSSSSDSGKSDADLLGAFGGARFLSGWRSAFKRHKPQDRYGSRSSSSSFSEDLPAQVDSATADGQAPPASEDDGAEGGPAVGTQGTEELISPQSWSSSRWAAPSKRIKAWVGSLREPATVRNNEKEAPLTSASLAKVPDEDQGCTSASPVASAMAGGAEESSLGAEAASLVHQHEPARGFSLQRWLSACRALHHGRAAEGDCPGEAVQEGDDAKPVKSNGPDAGAAPSKERLAAELALPALRADEEPANAAITAEPYDEQKALREALESSARIARGLSGRIDSLNASSAGENMRQEDAPGEEGELLGTGDLMDDGWYSKRVTSRGEASVSVSTAVDAFYAGLDQRSSGVGGEAACAPLAVMISRWLLRQGRLPTGPGEFDGIVKAGSQQWQKMCSKPANRSRFSDLHFDLETTLAAQRQKARVAVDAGSSYVGFFRPSQTPCEALDDMLQGTKPLQSIWREIADTTKGTATFIVGWNDHWFVIHVEEDGHCYLIDTLGEKLAEGCDCAFALRFPPTAPADDGVSSSGIDLPLHVMESVEACQQYLEAFYISATLKQLEKDLAKSQAQHGDCFVDVSIERVFRQLQIDFHRVHLRRVAGSPRRRSANQRTRAQVLPGAWSPSSDASRLVSAFSTQGDDDELEMSGLVSP